jgi:CDP-glycerol glycerophosphotransferase (TagB/SpsB family)
MYIVLKENQAHAEFLKLEKKYRYFKVYETGWCKVDSYFQVQAEKNISSEKPTIIYSSTFTKDISSAPQLIYVIKKLAQQRLWNWIITLHPKINDVELIEEYRNLARENTNVTFNDGPVDIQLLRKADVMLCDSSSIIVSLCYWINRLLLLGTQIPGIMC